MKKLTYILTTITLIAMTSSCFTVQTAPQSNRSNQKIIDLPKTTKKQNYKKSLDWIVAAFKSSKSVIQLKDSEAGKISAKGLVSAQSFYGGYFRIFITIEVKDNKARITCIAESIVFNTSERNIDKFELASVNSKMNALMLEYKKFMLTESKIFSNKW